jgi:predicted metal-dependent hydrolase
MNSLPQRNHSEALPVNWCNADAVTSSVMEAVSFVTPVLENFFIRTVVEGSRAHQNEELQARCRTFIHEESNHSLVHKKFNASLLERLGKQPPGLALVTRLLDAARQHLSISKRLALASALEHFAAVISKLYLNQQPRLAFESAYAKELFDMHAQEELAHRCVVFDLWLANGARGRLYRFTTILLVLFAGAAYVGIAVPWILHRKTGKRLGKTIAGLLGFVAKNLKDTLMSTPIVELFSFARKDFHPVFLSDVPPSY